MTNRFVTCVAILAAGCAHRGAEGPPDVASLEAPSPTDGQAAACRNAPSTYQKLEDLVYVPGSSGAAHRLDLYIPDGPGPFPLLVWIHGGGWRKGSKRSCPIAYQAARGYAVASVEYRLSGEARFPAQIHDVKAAVRWLRANAAAHRISPERIGVSGDSAGGHLASLLATSGEVAVLEDLRQGSASASSRVQAAAPFYGPTDLLRMNEQARAAGCVSSLDHDAPTSPESRLIGCPIQTCPELARAANPITYISGDDPPFLVEHGGKDCTVPTGQSRLLYEALRAAGLPAALVVVPDRGHEGAPFDRAVLDAFFDEHVRRCPSS